MTLQNCTGIDPKQSFSMWLELNFIAWSLIRQIRDEWNRSGQGVDKADQARPRRDPPSPLLFSLRKIPKTQNSKLLGEIFIIRQHLTKDPLLTPGVSFWQLDFGGRNVMTRPQNIPSWENMDYDGCFHTRSFFPTLALSIS